MKVKKEAITYMYTKHVLIVLFCNQVEERHSEIEFQSLKKIGKDCCISDRCG